MLAEEVVLPEHAWVSFPAHLSFEEAATLPCAGVTAYHALFEATHVGPGGTILVSDEVVQGCPELRDRFEPLGEVAIRGLADPMVLCRWRPLARQPED